MYHQLFLSWTFLLMMKHMRERDNFHEIVRTDISAVNFRTNLTKNPDKKLKMFERTSHLHFGPDGKVWNSL